MKAHSIRHDKRDLEILDHLIEKKRLAARDNRLLLEWIEGSSIVAEIERDEAHAKNLEEQRKIIRDRLYEKGAL